MDMLLDRLATVAGAFLVLSLVVEKINDWIKLHRKSLRTKAPRNSADSDLAEKKREGSILTLNILVGIGVAVFLKADAIQMMVSGQPGEVIGWENVFSLDDEDMDEMEPSNVKYFSSLSGQLPQSGWAWAYAFCGMVISGFALSFGSKFWHDLLGIIYQIKRTKETIVTNAYGEIGKGTGLQVGGGIDDRTGSGQSPSRRSTLHRSETRSKAQSVNAP